jgi:hypothetical protein
MHAVMGIVYGGFLTLFYPNAVAWFHMESGFGAARYGPISWVLSVFALGVFSSGIRDVMASNRLAR